MSDADWMDYDPAGALRHLYAHTWRIRHHPTPGGGTYWSVRRWHPAPEGAAEHRVRDSWEGQATASQVRAWLHQQERAMDAYRAAARA